MDSKYHYAVIERALREIDATGPALTLDALADRMGMSAAHFQRVFSAWVGVSPKRYQQYLTLDHARSLLAERFTVLDTALSTGLSGPSRLHDLFLTWEAMSPADYARGGAGLTICGRGFAADMGEAAAFDDLQRRWPLAGFVEDAARLRPWVQAALGGQAAPLALMGAPFQIKVWEALLRIPSGHVTSYGEIAAAIGNPKAVRAVGTAVGRNPISLLIPCHRALRKSGGLGGYHWGLPVKRAILAWESARADAAP